MESADTRRGKLCFTAARLFAKRRACVVAAPFRKKSCHAIFFASYSFFKIFGRKKLTKNSQKIWKLHKNSCLCGGIGRHKGLKIPRLNKPYRFKSDHKHHRKSAHFGCFFVILAAKTDLNKSARGRTPDAMPRGPLQGFRHITKWETGEIHSNFSRFVMFGKRLGSEFLPFLPKNRRFLLILFVLHNS